MRLLLLFALLSLLVAGCGVEKKSKAPEPKKEVKQSQPVDLSDNSAPLEVRALQGAKEVKKRIDDQRKENSPVVEEANK